jgi:ribonuclease D
MLWIERDGIAQSRDIAPGRILPDSAIVAVALNPPADISGLMSVRGFHGRGAEKHLKLWWRAIDAALALSEESLPELAKRSDAPPPPKVWNIRNPLAHARLSHARAAIKAISEEWSIPIENLLTPDTLRRLCWEPPEPSLALTHWLTGRGARPWQISLLEAALADALTATEPLPEPIPDEVVGSGVEAEPTT